MESTNNVWPDTEKLPRITTENFEEDPTTRGHIAYMLSDPLSTSEHLTHIDLYIETVGGERILLKRVDADKLAYIAHHAQRKAGRPVTGIEPMFTPEEIKLAAAGMRSLLDGRTETHIADCDRCQQSRALLAKLERETAL